MIKKYRKYLAFLFAGSFSMVLAACYGAPVDMVNQVSVKAVNSKNVPIQGLKITLFNNNQAIETSTTNSDGEILYPYLKEDEENDYTLKIEDIDNEENGLYLSKDVDIVLDKYDYNIEMSE